MKKILKLLALALSFALVLGLFAACGPITVQLTTDLTLMSFNIRTVASESAAIRNWANRKSAVINYLNGQDASVICMQEVTQSQYNDLYGGISSKYGIVYYARESGSDPEGLALAYDKSVWEKKSQSMFWLSETPDVMSKGWGANYYRICVNVLLQHKETGMMLNVFNVHLDHEVELARINGINLILDRAELHDYPTVLMGDFNCYNWQSSYTAAAEKYQDCQAAAPVTELGKTYTGWETSEPGTGSSIDFAFVSKWIMTPLTFDICRDMWATEDGMIVFGEDKANFLSDHYAIKTTVRVMYKS